VNVRPGSVHVVSLRQDLASFNASLELQHVVVDSVDEVYIHTIAAVSFGETKQSVDFHGTSEAVHLEARKTLGVMFDGEHVARLELMPYLTYMDGWAVSHSQHISDAKDTKAIIPCHSLWNSQGQRLQLVMVYQLHLTKKT
jgi:hypothetical protein